MNNKLGPMIISNPRRRGWGYRLRDLSLVLATLSLWGLFIAQTYMTVSSSNFLAEQAYVLNILKITALDFVAVFLVLHAWVLYERVLFRLRLRAYRRELAKQEAQPRLEAQASQVETYQHQANGYHELATQ
ncbi:hypothetical protein SAMN02745148_03536 [Modicisalibacter ilicicola DSM 19980]|uniref:Uncharacterized protein n=1 Tax=Modicisalibacter ilicicola DSM 19980 TaxID=1121942 RepID=A0A1M5EIX8_9GAMM|nr:hypothetical protein [Halomonas ilicicola]SHF79195.1 hypothetical protein SAMN02745148_03536 [Halomonas ilicicola DSM 19980]